MSALDDLLAAIEEMGHGESCIWWDGKGANDPCDCRLGQLLELRARVRAEMERGEMSDEELGDITAQHFSPLAWTSHRKAILAFGRAVERAVRERLLGSVSNAVETGGRG